MIKKMVVYKQIQSVLYLQKYNYVLIMIRSEKNLNKNHKKYNIIIYTYKKNV